MESSHLVRILVRRHKYPQVRTALDGLVSKGKISRRSIGLRKVEFSATRSRRGKHTARDPEFIPSADVEPRFSQHPAFFQEYLSFLEAMEQGPFKLTPGGDLTKASMNRLKDVIGKPRSSFSMLLVDMSISAGLAEKRRRSVLLTKKTRKLLMLDPIKHLKNNLTPALLGRYSRIGEDSFRDLLGMLLDGGEGWLKCSSLQVGLRSSLFQMGLAQDWLMLDNENFDSNLVPLLRRLDLVDAGTDAESNLHLRASALSRTIFSGMPVERKHRSPLTILPTNEILVPFEVEPKVRVGLERFAYLQKRDFTSIYHISEESLIRAGRFGFGREQVRAFLRKHSHTPLSQSLEHMLKGKNR